MNPVFFVRHGAVHNPDQIVYRRLPGFLLSPEGRQEAEAAASFLQGEPLDVIVHSPLERTRETAEMIAAEHSVQLVENELVHEGDESETPQVILSRMMTFWQSVKAAEGRAAAVVSHRDPIRILLMWLAGSPDLDAVGDLNHLPLPTGGIYRLDTVDPELQIDLVFQPQES